MKRVLFKVIVPTVFIAVWMWTCYLICNKTEGFDWFLYWILAGCPFGIRRMCLWLIPKNFGISGSIGVLALNCIAGGLIGGIVLPGRGSGGKRQTEKSMLAQQETFGQKVQKKKYRISGHFVQRWGSQGMTALLLSEKKEQKEMESMRDVDRVMEREIKKGSTPLQFEQLGFGDYSYNEISSKEKLLQVLSYLLRIGEYEPFAGKTIGNNVYMDMRGKKAVFKRTRLTYERNNIFATIKRLAKKYKPDYEGKVYLETVRCFFTISEEELEKCRYDYEGRATYAFVMSDIYILPIRKKSGGFGKYRAGGTFGSGAFYGKIRECQGSVISGIVS